MKIKEELIRVTLRLKSSTYKKLELLRMNDEDNFPSVSFIIRDAINKYIASYGSLKDTIKTPDTKKTPEPLDLSQKSDKKEENPEILESANLGNKYLSPYTAILVKRAKKAKEEGKEYNTELEQYFNLI